MMRTIALVIANECASSFDALTGGRRAAIAIGGRRLYQYIADELKSFFGTVLVASPEPAEGYSWLEVRECSLEDALMRAAELASPSDRVFVADGSIIVGGDAARSLVETAAMAGADGGVLAVPSRARGLAISVRSEGLLAGVGGEGQLIYGGLALLPARALKLLAAGLPFPSALSELAASTKIAVAVWSGEWYRIEDPVDILGALEHVMPDATYISPKAKVSPTAVLEGPVRVEAGAE
ncbi:MAG: NDP-sugar synthase, partial [Thermoproteus sp.]|nr:NDP-sugar synthase [Thermoproteus sp.]